MARNRDRRLTDLKRLTDDVQIRSGGNSRNAAAAQRGLALVITTVTDHRSADGQPPTEVPQTSTHHHAVLTPRDAELNEGSGI